MNGLDLTSWIEDKSSLDMPLWVLLGVMVVGGVMVFFPEDFFDRRGLKKIGWGVFCVGFAITILSVIGVLALCIHGCVEQSGNRLGDYVADAYGVSDYDCNLDAEDGVYECRRPVDDPDMSTYDSARRTETTLKVIIRDNRAYMYDENGNLMEMKQ